MSEYLTKEYLEQRRDELEAMSTEEKQALLRNLMEKYELTPEVLQVVRKLKQVQDVAMAKTEENNGRTADLPQDALEVYLIGLWADLEAEDLISAMDKQELFRVIFAMGFDMGFYWRRDG